MEALKIGEEKRKIKSTALSYYLKVHLFWNLLAKTNAQHFLDTDPGTQETQNQTGWTKSISCNKKISLCYLYSLHFILKFLIDLHMVINKRGTKYQENENSHFT